MAVFLPRKNLLLLMMSILCSTVTIGQKRPVTDPDYANWTLKELLFSIDSGLLDKQMQEEYLEHYLQKAKRLESKEDIVAAYKKKIGSAETYSLQMKYTDSLFQYGSKLKSQSVLGEAYYFKAYVELQNKQYDKALVYGLKAEEFLERSDNLYTLYKVKNLIGNTYYYLEEYHKAGAIFKTTASYHHEQRTDPYNNQMRYVLNLYSLSKTLYQLKKFDTLPGIIQQGYSNVKKLKSHHQPLDQAYFNFVDGMYHHSLKDYKTSDSLLQQALPEISKNEDFANEYLIYIYQGKNLWNRKKYGEAFEQFKRVDSLYHANGFMNKELSEAYTYLIDYGALTNNPQLQLNFTNTLLKISTELQKSNKNLTNYLHTHLDTKQLMASKEKLEKQLEQNQSWTYFAYVLLGCLLLAFLVFYVFHLRSQQKLRLKYEQLVAELPSATRLDEVVNGTPKETILNFTDESNFNDTQLTVLKKLKLFEERQEFLAKVSLDELAVRFSTNRTTLSKLLNEHKGGFTTYVNTLRINYALVKLSEPQSKLHLLTTDALAEEFGFGNPKSFSNAFKEIAGMSVSDFIKFSRQKS